MCCTTGLLWFSENDYVSARIAKICSDSGLQDCPRELLLAIMDDMYEPLASLFSAGDPLPDLAVFSTTSIRRRPNGRIDLLELYFPVIELDGNRILGEPFIDTTFDGYKLRPGESPVYNIGRGDCLTNDQMKSVNPDVPDGALLAGIDSLFENARASSESCRDEVGGPIEIGRAHV